MGSYFAKKQRRVRWRRMRHLLEAHADPAYELGDPTDETPGDCGCATSAEAPASLPSGRS